MEQRVSVITLGVADVNRAAAFYTALGWQPVPDDNDDVFFFQAGGLVFALWGRDQLAEDSTVSDNGGWGGITLAHNVRSPRDVDAVIDEARKAGAPIGRDPATPFWGGYSASSSIRTDTPGRSRTTPAGPSPPTERSSSPASA